MIKCIKTSCSTIDSTAKGSKDRDESREETKKTGH